MVSKNIKLPCLLGALVLLSSISLGALAQSGHSDDALAVRDSNKLKYEALIAYRKKNYELAYQHFLELAEQGDVYSTFQVGYMQFLGEGVQRSFREAKSWYHKSCELGYDLGCTAYEKLVEKGY